ncbi:hypothetical protein [Cytobacillus sp. NCCP-133]|uniref:hypothetical protein n=1 Tax=Cytobacillus sp. NCCP-133 TaxID=766848 RepID=UPI0022316C10|nr:hypothetical protein [Cytobacillus sp. NCCP-133]GLB61468.1 hypothetical protein NCCP133_35970 [Cytobacillus sp. NCCP-133]
MIALKEFASSFLYIVSWLLFAISAYLLYWTIIMPMLAIIPLTIMLTAGFLCRYFSKKWDSRGENAE